MTRYTFLDYVDYYGIKSEFIGTFMVVSMIGLATENIYVSELQRADSSTESRLGPRKDEQILYIALVTGLSYCLFTWTCHIISRAMFNPLITLILMVMRRVDIINGTLYIAAQVLATAFGCSLLEFFAPDKFEGPIDKTMIVGFRRPLQKALSMHHRLAIMTLEATGSMMVTMAYFMVIESKRSGLKVQGLVMGCAYGALTMSMFSHSMAAINPVRLLGGLILRQEILSVWHYYVGQIIGTVLGAIFMQIVMFIQASSLQTDKGMKIEGKEDVNIVQQYKEMKRRDSIDDYFGGINADLAHLEEKKRIEKELRKKGFKAYDYEDSDEEGDEVDPNNMFKDGYLDGTTGVDKKKINVDLETNEELGEALIEVEDRNKGTYKETAIERDVVPIAEDDVDLVKNYEKDVIGKGGDEDDADFEEESSSGDEEQGLEYDII